MPAQNLGSQIFFFFFGPIRWERVLVSSPVLPLLLSLLCPKLAAGRDSFRPNSMEMRPRHGRLARPLLPLLWQPGSF
ncbi:hypothetical protein F4779DRAFT_383291 [Xylariaceae sp. FL0662B]|nr:hypothetical protein F4779DRAFT_383291 [Xylariaceae sp. FL0662B]